MIRLAFSTLGCPSWPLARALDAASRLGYDGVELRFVEGDDALCEIPGSALEELFQFPVRIGERKYTHPLAFRNRVMLALDPRELFGVLLDQIGNAEQQARTLLC